MAGVKQHKYESFGTDLPSHGFHPLPQQIIPDQVPVARIPLPIEGHESFVLSILFITVIIRDMDTMPVQLQHDLHARLQCLHESMHHSLDIPERGVPIA